MIGMNFPSFLGLLVISGVCAFVFHGLLRLRVVNSGVGYLAEWIIGWIGAWIGSAVVGHWGVMVPDSSNIYLGPAILGAVAVIYLVVALVKMAESLLTPLSIGEIPVSSDDEKKIA